MHKIIRLPQVELNLENATVVEILANVGAFLKDKDILMTIETQKAIEEVPCGASGYLRTLLVAEGEQVDLHDPLAVLTDLPDEEFDLPKTKAPQEVRRLRPRPAARTGQTGTAKPPPGKVRSVPAARRRARDLGIDLTQVAGSGPEGRVTVSDVESHATSTTGKPSPRPAAGVPLTGARKALIEQMERGHREIPQISISRNLDVTPLKERSEGITFTAIVVYHIARALVGHEALRTVFTGERLRLEPVDIAVAMDTPHGLLAPVVRGADRLEVEEISRVIRQYRERAGENRLKGEELRPGPFAVTNLGMFGVDLFTPLVFAGQTAVLAIGRAADSENRRSSAWFTLAVDHRVVDGAEAARFLETLRREIDGK